ncbi:IclR family transcriptional regulator [Paradesulfitobacterium aromaticivorans]
MSTIPEKPAEKQSGVQSLRRALGILDVFTFDKSQLSMAEICASVNLPRPTVARLLTTLIDEGYVVRNFRKYSLGVKLCRLGAIAQRSRELKEVALPVLREMRDCYGETVYIDVVEGLERHCIMSIEGNQAIRIIVPVGQRSPLHAGADGRVLLAYQPEKVIEELIKQKYFTAITDHTITDLKLLKNELQRIRDQGFAVSYGEWVQGSVAISAPIVDETGDVVAGVSMSVPDYRTHEQVIDTYIKAVRDAAVQISKGLGFMDCL